MTTEWSAEEIEASRRRNGVDPAWQWTLCEAGCGDIVWVPDKDALIRASKGVPVVLVCSVSCGRALLARMRPLS